MEQLVSIWSSLDSRRRVIVILATLAMFAAIILVGRMASTPRMALLYSGLEPQAAGEVVTALEARGAEVDVRGSAIYVPAADRDELRLSLAGDGLPTNGAQGYELLDTLSGFGTTAQMFDAAYWRAKEGELARTIAAGGQISSARVHISTPARDPFTRGKIGSASVSVSSNGGLTGAQGMAIRYLVASAIAGLTPENVTVVDSISGLMPLGDATGGTPGASADNRAEMLKRNVTRLLEARVGRGRAIVEVTIEPVTEREEITERRIDPESRIPISTDREETSTSSKGSRGGNVTVASNLPDGDAAGSSSDSESRETRSHETTNYEISETQRAVVKEPGAIRRISVAALVDGESRVGEDGTAQWAPRDEEELTAFRELIASAVGFDEARGDTITVRTLQFQALPELPEPTPLSFVQQLDLDAMSLIQIAVAAFVALILGLFVVRPILSRPTPLPALESSGEAGSVFEALPDMSSGYDPEVAAGLELQGLEAPDEEMVDPKERLKALVSDKQDETIAILNQWMTDRGTPA